MTNIKDEIITQEKNIQRQKYFFLENQIQDLNTTLRLVVKFRYGKQM